MLDRAPRKHTWGVHPAVAGALGAAALHCKPKPCIAHRELPVSQFPPCEPIPTGKNLFSLKGTPFLIAGSLFSLQGFPCTSLLGIAV